MGRKNATEYVGIRRSLLELLRRNGASPLKLPPLKKLAERYNVTAPTVMRAVNDLIDEGYLTKRKGGGTVSTGSAGRWNRVKIFGIVNANGMQAFDVSFFWQLNSAFALELTGRDPQVFCTANLYLESPSCLSGAVKNDNLAGLLLLGVSPRILEEAEKLHDDGLPAISAFRESETISCCPHLDDEAVQRKEQTLVLKRLAREGCRSVLVCESDMPDFWQKQEALMRRVNSRLKSPLELTFVRVGARTTTKSCRGFADGIEGTIDAVMLYGPISPPVYESISRTFPQDTCCYVTTQFILPRSVNYSGYVVEYGLDACARNLVDDMLAQVARPRHPHAKYDVQPRLVRYRTR